MRLVAATLCLALWGCDLVERRAAGSRCKLNADCYTQLCYFGSCFATNVLPGEGISVRIIPPAPKPFLPQEVPLATNTPAQLISWQRPTTWRGLVVDAQANPVGGSLTVRRTDDTVKFTARSTYQQNVYGFTLYLAPGSYSVEFTPDPTHPPSATIALSEPWVVGTDNSNNVTVVYPSATPTVRGRIATSKEDLTGRSISDALVYASVDGSSLLSARGNTDSNGEFNFKIGASSGTFTLHIEPSASNPFVPYITIPGFRIAPATALGDIYIGEIGSPVTVRGTVVGSAGSPIAGAAVTAAATLGLGTYRTSSISDSNGVFSLAVVRPSGTSGVPYTLRARPPQESGFATTASTYTVPASGEAPLATISCAKREALDLRVIDAGGKGVKNAIVLVTPIDPSNFQAQRIVSGADGRFTLQRDDADYTVDVVPVAGSQLPRLRMLINRGDDVSSLQLPRAALVAGEVVGQPSNQRLLGASLQFRRAGDLIGEALVDDYNHFSVALPVP